MSNDLVSVIMPVFNVQNYVVQAIESIQNQTYSNLEIIVVDDCSTDGTYQLIQDIARQDKRIKLYRNKRNLKIAKTLNRAISCANGAFIARMDGDDISALDRIEKKVNFLINNPEIDVVGCSLKAIDLNDNIIGSSKHYSDPILLDKTIKLVTPLSHIWVARKMVYDQLNGYRDISGVEDYDFVLRMKSSGLKYSNLENYFGYFVRLGREGNTISTFGVKQLKMRSYAYRLYKQRVREGSDDFSESKLSRLSSTSLFAERLHAFSSLCLYRAIKARGNKNYFGFLFLLILCLASPFQFSYLLSRLKYRIITRSHYK